MIRSLTRWSLGFAVSLVLLIALLLFTLLYTSTGSRWAVEQAVKSSPQISVGGFEGRLWDRFELGDVRFDSTAATVTIDHLAVHWRLRALLDRTLSIDALILDGVELTLSPAPAGEAAPPPTALPAPPLPMVLQHLELRRFTLHSGEREVLIDRLEMGAAWDATAFELTGFDIEAYGQRVGLAGSVAVGKRPNLAASADWHGDLGGEPGQASLEITGPLSALEFQTTLDAAVSAQVSGSIEPLADVPKLTVHGSVDTPALGEDITLGQARFDIAGTFESLAVSITADADTPLTGAYTLSLDTQLVLPSGADEAIVADVEWRAQPRLAGGEIIFGSGVVRYEDNALRIDHATATPYRTRLTGDIALAQAGPTLALNLTWSDIAYVLSESQVVKAHEGTLEVTGTLEKLIAQFGGDFDLPTAGRVVVAGAGQMIGERFALTGLTTTLLGGEIQAEGEVAWAGEPTGTVHFSARDIDLSALHAESPSRLAFNGSGGFRAGADGVTSEVELMRVSGFLRGQAVTGSARVRTRPRALVVEQAQFDVGPNHIFLNGTWAEEMDGRFDLRLNDLAVFDSRLGGKLSGSGALSGQASLPRIDARLQGEALQFDQVSADSFEAIVDLDLSRDRASRADLTVEALMLEDRALGRLSFAGKGNAQAHGFRLTLDGETIQLEAAANGTLQDESWRGRLRELRINAATAGIWSLTAPSTIALAADRASLTEACFASDAARACVAGDQTGSLSKLRVNLSALPLSLADPYLPTTIRLRGRGDGTADLQVADGIVTGSGRIGVSDGAVERNAGDSGTADKVGIDAFALEFNLTPQSIEAQAEAAVEQWFTLHGSLKAQRAAGGTMAGALDARSADISWLAEFVPQISGSHGAFELTSKLDGSFDHPNGHARATLASGALRIPDIGLEIDRFEAELRGDPGAVDLSATIGAGNGTLNMDGAVVTDEKNRRRYDLKLDGRDFPLVRIPEAEADVSPALRLVGDPEALHVSGELLVPRVFIDVKRLPNSAVSVSEDQIIVSADGSVPEEVRAGSFMTDAVSGEVTITLGEDISINGFGLTSKFSGGVDWSKKRGSALGSANGAIVIEEGLYKAFGQHLEIEKGRLQFAGPPDNPGLDLRAVRPDLPVKAGVEVRGTVRKPEITLFSEPPESDANTLSYIVTGRALDDASAGDAAVLAQAALSLGADQSASVTHQIADMFGLDELSVAAGSEMGDTSLIAGKRLSPKLSVRTDFNPFDQLWSFFVNYKLTQRWSVEAESGEREGADLLYSIEKERLIDALLPFD